MGQSTDASVCFGIPFEEGTEFPWSEYNDFDDWYLYKVLGYKSSIEIYDEKGEYLNGINPSSEMISKYYDEKTKFIKDNPKCPVELITHCYHECPMYIIGSSGTEQTANRGYPQELKNISNQDTDVLSDIVIDFCKKYNIKHDTKPTWLLYSYWG